MIYRPSMLMLWSWIKRCSWLLTALLLASCSAQQNHSADGATTVRATAAPSTFAALDQLQRELRTEPAQCEPYRQQYVAAFALNVEGLSNNDAALERQAEAQFAEALQQFTVTYQGFETPASAAEVGAICLIPQCIIEPLQEGKLTYWCGYRVDGQRGQQVNIWFEWETLEPTR